MSQQLPLIRVIIADDHHLVRAGFVSIISLLDQVQVIGEASNGKEVMEVLRQQPADIVLMDLEMPVMGGLEATGLIANEFPQVKVLIITMLHDVDLVRKVVALGARGMLFKNARLEVLQKAIDTVYHGETYFDDHIAETISEEGGEKALPAELKKLTMREFEVIRLVAKGYSSTFIGQMLHISSRTVDTHRTNILRKLGLPNTPALIRFALEQKLLD
jgi:two-component system nitrate/nitrite response regulator NarL